MRKFLVLAAVVLGVGVGLVPAVSAHSASRPYCGIYWGSLPEHDPDFTSAAITNLRAGRHGCFDRLVVDLGSKVGGLPGRDESGYRVEYATQVVEPGSGRPVPLAGGAVVQVIVNAAAHDADGTPTYSPADPAHAANVSGFRTFRQVAFVGTFEGQTTIGLGVRARLPFRVFILSGPGSGSRLVIDVAHRW